MADWYRLNRLSLDLDEELSAVPERIGRLLGVPSSLIGEWTIRRKALDARGRRKPFFVLNVDFCWRGEPEFLDNLLPSRPDLARVAFRRPRRQQPGTKRLSHRPIIVGSGPAGLMAALRLAEAGYRPLLLERGGGIEERVRAVETFWRCGELDPETNIQFGAGGAGTFSDGKLVTRIKDPAAIEVLATLVGAGAPEEIRYEAKPHVGTDRLQVIVARLEERIAAAGGEIRFGTRVDGPVIRQGKVCGVRLAGGEELPAEVLILAAGNSAREIYEDLFRQGVGLEPKPIAVGFRIEHPQDLIDKAQYGRWAGHPKLGAADYRLTHHYAPGNRGVYSFCMCPGGFVVAAASEPEGVVTNGMSYYARDSGIANSAIVAAVRPEEYGADGPLAGVAFQRRWEQRAFRLGGGGFTAPGQRVSDFLAGRPSRDWQGLTPTYRPGVVPSDLSGCLPDFLINALKEALRRFDGIIPGFAGRGVLTGVETRTSAPVRILRREDFQSINLPGLYPCGEGSGYAGGIVSAAVDGLHAAEAIIREYRPPGA